MPFCLVPDCKNNSNDTKGTRISYHRLPLDEKLAQQWLEKTKRANPPKRNSCYVCSDHFDSDCFERSYKFELTGQKEKRALKDGAVPTIFKFAQKGKPKERTASIKRRRKRENSEVSSLDIFLCFFF